MSMKTKNYYQKEDNLLIKVDYQLGNLYHIRTTEKIDGILVKKENITFLDFGDLEEINNKEYQAILNSLTTTN